VGMWKRLFPRLSLFGAAFWQWLLEFIRSLFYERGSHMLAPYLDNITLDQFFRWGPTIGFPLLGLFLFWHTSPKVERDKLAKENVPATMEVRPRILDPPVSSPAVGQITKT
jgi:hypothetical protein